MVCPHAGLSPCVCVCICVTVVELCVVQPLTIACHTQHAWLWLSFAPSLRAQNQPNVCPMLAATLTGPDVVPAAEGGRHGSRRWQRKRHSQTRAQQWCCNSSWSWCEGEESHFIEHALSCGIRFSFRVMHLHSSCLHTSLCALHVMHESLSHPLPSLAPARAPAFPLASHAHAGCPPAAQELRRQQCRGRRLPISQLPQGRLRARGCLKHVTCPSGC